MLFLKLIFVYFYKFYKLNLYKYEIEYKLSLIKIKKFEIKCELNMNNSYELNIISIWFTYK